MFLKAKRDCVVKVGGDRNAPVDWSEKFGTVRHCLQEKDEALCAA